MSSTVAPSLGQAVIDECGWQIAIRFFGLLILISWPIAFCWLKEPNTSAERQVCASSGHSQREALRTPIFWLLGTSFLLWGVAASGNIFLIPFLTDQGMTRADAAALVSMLGMTTLVGLPVLGSIIDRVHAPVVAAVSLLVTALSFASLAMLSTRIAFVAVPLAGLAGAAWMSCLDYSTGRYFGMRAFAEISANFDRMASIGAIMGPLVFGALRQYSGGYFVPYIVVALLAAMSSMCMAVVGRYKFRPIAAVVDVCRPHTICRTPLGDSLSSEMDVCASKVK